MKKYLSILLTVVLVFSFAPLSVGWADEVAGEPTVEQTLEPAVELDSLSQAQPDGTQEGEDSVDRVQNGDGASQVEEASAASDEQPDTQSVFSTLSEAEDAGAIATLPNDAEAYVEGEILVVLAGEDSEARETAAVEESIQALSESDAAVETAVAAPESDEGATVLVELPDDVSVADALLQMANDENVAYAQPNYVYRLFDDEGSVDAGYAEAATFADASELDPLRIPNDPYVKDPKSGMYQWWLANVKAFEAWDRQTVGGTVTVAVVDTGARLTHKDLKNNIHQNLAWDSYRNQQLLTSVKNGQIGNGGDMDGHGTHVAGIVAAEAGNNFGGAGASYNAKILPINIFYKTAKGDVTASTRTLLAAYDYIMAHRQEVNIKVVNLSLGGADDPAVHSAIQKANNAGILTVCAAGNSGDKVGINVDNTPTYPSDYDECVSVVSVDQSNNRMSYSEHNKYKNIAAPGSIIISTSFSSDDAFVTMGGTSMASPVVAGVAALVFAKDQSLSPYQAKTILYNTATDLGTKGWDKYYGSGLVNAQAALALAQPDFNNAIIEFSSALNRNKCLDIPGASTKSAVQVALWDQGHKPNQRFRLVSDGQGYYTITNVKSNLLLDISGGSTSNGAKVIQYPATGGNNQKWKLIQNLNGSYTIVSKLNENLCLDLYGAKSTNDTPLIVWQRGTNKGNQQFFLYKVTAALGNGTYTIKSAASGQMLDIEGASKANLARAVSWPANNGVNQRFVLTYNQQTGYYKIVSANSNKALDVTGASTADGAAVIQYDSNGAFNQQWYIEKASDGSFCLYASHSGKLLDLKGGGKSNLTPIIVWSKNGGINQRWVLKAA